MRKRLALAVAVGLVVVGFTVLATATQSAELDFRYVSIDQLWMDVFLDFPTTYRSEITHVLEGIKAFGFKGISVNITYFFDASEHLLFPEYDPENDLHGWRYSPEDWMLEVLFECIRDVGLDGDLRLEAVAVEAPGDPDPPSRFDYFPYRSNAEKFLRSYETHLIRLARILERTDADVFSLFTELPMIEDYSDRVREILDNVAAIFPGQILIEQDTHHFIRRYPETYQSGNMSRYAAACGDYWNWESRDGRKVIIGYSWWPDSPGIEYSPNLETMTTEIVYKWSNMIGYHRQQYPGHQIVFAEVGIYNEGNQQLANSWSAYLTAIDRMGFDGFSIWSICLGTWAGYGTPKPLTLGHCEISSEPVISAITPFLD